jgi:hypothetical protein
MMKLKNTFFGLAALLIAFLVVSCSEEIELSSEPGETAVVYALLDQEDSLHYIRINRAFYGTSNSLEAAKIPDSSYFKSVDAKVYEVRNQKDTLRVWTLRDTTVSNKDVNGIFYAPTQKLYYFATETNAPLIANKEFTYYFKACINNTYTISSSTPLIRDASLASNLLSTYGFISTFNTSDNKYSSTNVSFKNGTSTTINTSLYLTVNEFKGSNVTSKRIEWNIADLETSSNKNNIAEAKGEAFFDVIKKNCSVDKTITKRQLASIETVVTFGSEELRQYILYSKPSSSIAQNKPTYTNIVSSNPKMRVRGLFSARTTKRFTKKSWEQVGSAYYRAIDQATTRELCKGSTIDLLFCSDVPDDSKETFYCK